MQTQWQITLCEVSLETCNKVLSIKLLTIYDDIASISDWVHFFPAESHEAQSPTNYVLEMFVNKRLSLSTVCVLLMLVNREHTSALQNNFFLVEYLLFNFVFITIRNLFFEKVISQFSISSVWHSQLQFALINKIKNYLLD